MYNTIAFEMSSFSYDAIVGFALRFQTTTVQFGKFRQILLQCTTSRWNNEIVLYPCPLLFWMLEYVLNMCTNRLRRLVLAVE
uniref:Uncharacterized protein n=1 Tax=Arundo donax TaxID=35708 RepID=A0A0A9DN71_ARUDO